MPDRSTEHAGVRTRRSRRWVYPSSAGEFTVHAGVLAAILWAAVAVDIVAPGMRGRYSGLPKGNDFLQFYVAASAVKAGEFGVLVDDRAFRAAQQPYLGNGAPTSYPAVYGPQIGVLLAPLATLPYEAAYFTWVGITVLLIGTALVVFFRACPALRQWRLPFMVAAAAFAPIPYLILAGQLSAVALACLALLYVALSRRRPALAGVAIGLLAYKPSLFAPALAVACLAGEWRVSLVAALVASAETVGLAPFIGAAVIRASLENMTAAARHPGTLAGFPFLMLSWRTFWRSLLGPGAAVACYAGSAGVTLLLAAWCWRRASSALERVGTLAIAVVLAAPHLFMYDLVLVVPALAACANRITETGDKRLRIAAIAAFLSPLLVPVSAWTGMQVITPILFAWLVAMALPLRGSARAHASGAQQVRSEV